MSGETWKFVTVSEDGKPRHAKDRVNIRKAAMLTFRRQQRLERVEKLKAECAAQAEARASACFLTWSLASSEAPKESSMQGQNGPKSTVGTRSDRRLGANKRYPLLPANRYRSFETAVSRFVPRDLGYPNDDPNKDHSGLAYLFNYFISDIVPIMLPMRSQSARKALRDCWGSNLLSDPMILQAAASCAALHLDYRSYGKQSQLVARHHQHAVHLVRQRLASTSTSREIDNGVLGAVALLAFGSGSCFGDDVAESHVHMSALAEMVKLKGGKETLAPTSTPRMVLSWADATSAQLARSRPRLASISPQSTTSEIPFSQEPEIFKVIGELREITALKKSLDTSTSTTISEIVAFDTKRNALEERILCARHIFLTTPNLDFHSRCLEICSIATLIFLNSTFRNVRPDFSVQCILKRDLMASFLNIEASYMRLNNIHGSDTPYAEYLLWALLIGGGLWLDASEKIWFAQRISIILNWTSVTSWEEAEACLRRILWLDKLNNDARMLLWDKVEHLRGLKITSP